MLVASVLIELSTHIFYILLPLFFLYIAYLVITKAFNEMGFSSLDAIIIVLLSFILGSGIVDRFFGLRLSNITLFTYGNWIVGINTGGAVIPILLSIYLAVKNKLTILRVVPGVLIVAIVAYFVTYPDPRKGIVSDFPLWLLPVFFASLASIALTWKDRRKAAPLAYISGTLGVLVGADFFHLLTLLRTSIPGVRNPVIGGASVFDMVFITGILAVIVDSILIYQKEK